MKAHYCKERVGPNLPQMTVHIVSSSAARILRLLMRVAPRLAAVFFSGHVFRERRRKYPPYSRYGVDIQRSSDDTYLRRYGLGNQYSLTSRAYIEGAEGRNFARGDRYYFKDCA